MNRCVRIKIPVLLPDQPIPEVISNDQKAKERMKGYADKVRNASHHNIASGDTVLVRQQRRNKFSTPFEPIPYIVERVKGTMIMAKRTIDQRRITRNSSHYKKVGKAPDFVQMEQTDDSESWNFEADVGNASSGTEENIHISETEQRVEGESSPNQSQLEDHPPTLRRSRRSRRKPAWMVDYQL